MSKVISPNLDKIKGKFGVVSTAPPPKPVNIVKVNIVKTDKVPKK